ncbi:hypothetical protein AB5I39_04415 [Sphingomonas sp. MMS24-J45]|uniref:hypothetical protein n=1 Tax=Sphingomonas sp. MMS24-J45 TaxID=3238806 RepID=UPI00384B4C40
MSDDKLNKFGDLYREIGRELAAIVGDPDKTLLYVEADEGWVGPNVFKDEGNQIRYFDPSRKLTDLLFEVWTAEDPDKRWSAMEYTITGTKFTVEFVFPEKFGDDFDNDERRELVLQRHYGDKPRVYPPPGDMGWLLRELN